VYCTQLAQIRKRIVDKANPKWSYHRFHEPAGREINDGDA